MAETGRNRSINRKKCQLKELEQQLEDSTTTMHAVYKELRQMLLLRKKTQLLSPLAQQRVLSDLDARLFALQRHRSEPNKGELSQAREEANVDSLTCLHNVSGQEVSVWLDQSHLGDHVHTLVNLLDGQTWSLESEYDKSRPSSCLDPRGIEIQVPAYGYLWLAAHRGDFTAKA